VLIDIVAQRYPELKANIQSYQIATPLTFRDYMGSPDGSIYGIMADVNNPAQTQIPLRTKIPNLLLAGQNIGLHGVLGVSINAIAVAGALVGLDYLLQKINKC
jgi:all-trans-retinol 13,14-reductase